MNEITTAPPVHKNVTDNVTNKIRRFFEWPLGRFSLVGNRPFFDSDQFPWTESLEAGWQEIQQELWEVLSHEEEIPNFQDVSPTQAALTQGEQWKTYFFYGYGYKVEKNCAECPRTAALIEQIPGFKTAFFSILSPHKHIPAHRGPYKGVLRYHLGLIVPEPKAQCRIRVDKEFANWEEGRSIIFDDCFEHEVWNDTEGRRVVLFVDFVRPLPFPLSTINRLIIKLIALTPFVQESRNIMELKKTQPKG
jgi:aspartyl/asparaginyl beta-hydroxylase (cupin superfamily)